MTTSYIGRLVRTVSRDGETWFVLDDVRGVLGIVAPLIDSRHLSSAVISDSSGRGRVRHEH